MNCRVYVDVLDEVSNHSFMSDDKAAMIWLLGNQVIMISDERLSTFENGLYIRVSRVIGCVTACYHGMALRNLPMISHERLTG